MQLDGFDVSGEQFPVPEYLPNNVRLYEQDAMKEPPQELQGQYDVVHVRLFLAVITGEDPGTVLGTCYKLLSKLELHNVIPSRRLRRLNADD